MHPVIASRRRKEDLLAVYEHVVADNKKTALVVDFELAAQTKLAEALAEKKARYLRDKGLDALDDRRRKLAILLNAEQAALEKEIEASLETPQQVKERCVGCMSFIQLCVNHAYGGDGSI